MGGDKGTGVRKDTVLTVPSISGSEYSNILSSGLPAFYFGTKILEQEIELIKSRDNDLFTSGLDELMTELNVLESQKSDAYVIYLEYLHDLETHINGQIKIIDKYIVENPTTATALYNIEKMKIGSSSVSSYLIVLISLLIGIIIASIIITLLRVIQNSKVK